MAIPDYESLVRAYCTGANMSDAAIGDRAARHVAAFNDTVRSGKWADFAGRFTAEATNAVEVATLLLTSPSHSAEPRPFAELRVPLALGH